MSDGDGAGRESAPPFVALEGITKRFPGVVANDDVSLELRPGEVHALIGENGAGKSTLMRILYGMYPSDAGRIVIRGEEVRIHSPRDAIARGIGMVHQHFVLVDPFTVAENVILGDEGGRDPPARGVRAEGEGARRRVRVPDRPARDRRGPLGRRGTARRDLEGALPRGRDPRPWTSRPRSSPRRRRATCSRTSAGSGPTGSPSSSSATSWTRCSRSRTDHRAPPRSRRRGRRRRRRRRRRSSPR